MERFKVRMTIGVVSVSIATLLGNGCGTEFVSEESVNRHISSINEQPVEKTSYGVKSVTQILDTMVSVSGLEFDPTGAHRGVMDEFNLKKGMMSQSGRADSITGPMFLAVASIAAEICDQVIRLEDNVSDDDRLKRRFFKYLNLDRGLEDQPEEGLKFALEDGISLMARSFWGRNPEPSEVQLIVQSAEEVFTLEGSNQDDTFNLALFVCTGMLGSVESVMQQ